MQTTEQPAELSIIIPANNKAAALDNLLPELHQQIPNAEHILVDDGSRDETVDRAIEGLDQVHTVLVARRTELADDRTRLAGDRTLLSTYRSVLAKGRTELAFIRTGLAFITLGMRDDVSFDGAQYRLRVSNNPNKTGTQVKNRPGWLACTSSRA